MNTKQFSEKFGISPEIGKKIHFRDKAKIVVKSYSIYDFGDKNNPQVKEIEQLLRNNPNYEIAHWQQSGPCSNWGQDILRLETDEEYENRIRNKIKKYE